MDDWLAESRSVPERQPFASAALAAWALAGLCLVLGGLLAGGAAGRLMAPEGARWGEGLFLVLAAGALGADMLRRLPLQSVLAAVILVAGPVWLLHGVSSATGLPFGRIVFTERMGLRLPAGIPLAIPVLWIVVFFASRGTGEMLLRPWRENRFYGLWLMGMTGGLMLLVDLGLEPFATRIQGLWSWPVAPGRWAWFDSPLINFGGWMAASLLLMVLTTPFLINKRPVAAEPGILPVFLWFALVIRIGLGLDPA